MSQGTAQAKVSISSIGLAIPGTSVGLNGLTGCYLQIRKNAKAPIITYGIKSHLDMSGNSGALVVGHASTDWFSISDDSFSTLQLDQLKGKGYLANIEVSSTIVGSGATDIKMSLITSKGDLKDVFEKLNIKSSGFQVDSTKIRGNIYLLPNKK